MINKKCILYVFFLYQLLSYSIYQNNNSKKLISKESIKIKGKIIEFKGTNEILIENKNLKTIENIIINQDTKEISLVFNHEDVELNIEENKYLNIDVSQDIDKRFTMSFEKQSDYVEDENWKLVTVTAIYR
ncbi:hypothetical protein [Cetobacterium sp.]|uniref:hypothetical protein n=1 Tax=Cetobacterium sp. TaxID=2071632 RepID=UPI003EE4A9CE